MKLKVTKVVEMDAELHGFKAYPSRYHHGSVQHSYEGKKLFIKGELEDGRLVSFYSPVVEISVASGMLNYKKLNSVNGWYKEIDHGYTDVKNALYYEGSTEMPMAIIHKSEIVPAVAVGDEIDIEFKVKGMIGKESRLWYVKLKK